VRKDNNVCSNIKSRLVTGVMQNCKTEMRFRKDAKLFGAAPLNLSNHNAKVCQLALACSIALRTARQQLERM
jgi:hypothetical protein